jgi:hypothetical protein
MKIKDLVIAAIGTQKDELIPAAASLQLIISESTDDNIIGHTTRKVIIVGAPHQ